MNRLFFIFEVYIYKKRGETYDKYLQWAVFFFLPNTNAIEKMFKEFPYYDRCKPIFTSTDSPAVQPGIAPAAGINNHINEVNTIMKPDPIHMTNEPCSPTLETNGKRNLHPTLSCSMKKIKARKTIPISSSSSSSIDNK